MLTRKPLAGDRVRWPHWAPDRIARVVSTPPGDDNLCWIDDRGLVAPFIWRFWHGLNSQAEIVGETC